MTFKIGHGGGFGLAHLFAQSFSFKKGPKHAI